MLEGIDNFVNAVCLGAGKIMSTEAPHVWVSLRRDKKRLVMYLRVRDAFTLIVMSMCCFLIVEFNSFHTHKHSETSLSLAVVV